MEENGGWGLASRKNYRVALSAASENGPMKDTNYIRGHIRIKLRIRAHMNSTGNRYPQ